MWAMGDGRWAGMGWMGVWVISSSAASDLPLCCLAASGFRGSSQSRQAGEFADVFMLCFLTVESVS